MSLETVVIAESSLLRVAESGRDGVTRHIRDLGFRVGNDLAALNVETFDFRQRAADELRDDSEGLGGVDCQALAVEGSVTHAVAVEIASIGIAHASIARL